MNIKSAGQSVSETFVPWLVSHLVVVAAMAAAWYVRTKTSVDLPADLGRRADRYLMGWDATWYEQIADAGYRDVVAARGEEVLRFFPLLPLLARALSPLMGTSTALLGLAAVSSLLAGMAVSTLAGEITRSPVVASRARWALYLSPPAFVLAMGYTDGLAIALAAWTLVAARRGSWPQVIVCGVLAGLLRPTGVLLVVPIAFEVALLTVRSGPNLLAMVSIGSPVAGVASYLAWVQHAFGDWRLPIDTQQVPGLRGEMISPLSTVDRALGALVDGDLGVGQAHVVLLVALVLCLMSLRRLPNSAVLYGVVSLVVALSSERLGSLARYVWGSVVPIVTIAARGGRLGLPLLRVLSIAGGVLLFVSATASFLGYYVP